MSLSSHIEWVFRPAPARRGRCGSAVLWTLGTILVLVHAPLADELVKLRSGREVVSAYAAEPGPSRQYAPDRPVDLLHLALDVTPDFPGGSVSGTATLSFKPLVKPLVELRLDAVALRVRQVVGSALIEAWQSTAEELVITFAQPLPPGDPAWVRITYSATPVRGLYFRTPDLGYRPGETHLFTQGEEIEARHWYPCFDAPNEKFTSEITCRVPSDMTVLSNGRLESQETDPVTGLVAVRWRQDQPHVNYLVALVAGYFRKVEDHYRNVPLAFYTLPSELNQAQSSFRGTRDMMAFFEEETGFTYPWAKYDQVCVNDFVAGGMENTSLTILTDSTLFTEATENVHSSEGLVAHELAHQWFGDLVTCKDWSHVWLNEGFATYYEALYQNHRHGRAEFLYRLYQGAQHILEQTEDTRPIVTRQYASPGEQFSYRTYGKAGWVLHMLRSQLGEELYRNCIRTYLQRHQFGSVVTDDLRAVIEELSGRSLDQFFDQWMYHGRFPDLDVAFSWDQSHKLAKISVQQIQKLSESVLLFQLPLPIRFRSQSGVFNRDLIIKQPSEDFYFPLPEAPDLVRLDPELTVLARIRFTVPEAMLSRQLEDAGDLVGRLLAIEQMAQNRNRETVIRLQQVLNQDPFYGVRLAAAEALRKIHSDEARQALLESTRQSDARVRLAVVQELGRFFHPTVLAALQQSLREEQNPAILSAALRALAPYACLETQEILLRFLRTPSYRNQLAEAAIATLRAQAQPDTIPALLEWLAERESESTSYGFADGLGALAYLARHAEKKDTVREFLSRQVNHRKRRVQLAAVDALGTLGDPRALPVLQTFASAATDDPAKAEADKALAAIRAARKPVEELDTLRQEVFDLQKANRDLRRDLDDLQKKFNALAPAAKP